MTTVAACNKVDVINIESAETAEAASMQAARLLHAVASSASSLYVFGGWGEGINLASCEMLNTHSTR